MWSVLQYLYSRLQYSLQVSLASGPDGSLYVGDYNLIRKISPQGVVTTILQFRWARLV